MYIQFFERKFCGTIKKKHIQNQSIVTKRKIDLTNGNKQRVKERDKKDGWKPFISQFPSAGKSHSFGAHFGADCKRKTFRFL